MSIQSALYRQPVLLDSQAHRGKRVQPLTDLSITAQMHAVYLTATEFPQAGLDFPIIFVRTGEQTAGGAPMVSPVALLGITPNENLHLDGGRWDARYLPAFIRRFPFLTAGVPGQQTLGVYVDASWSGFSDTEGEPLFDESGERTEALTRALDFLQRFDEEHMKTRAFCERLVQLDLLKDMQADATLPGGQHLKVDGFLTVDEERWRHVVDEVVVEFHRTGMAMLVHAHLMSLANVRHLVDRKARRLAAAAAPGATA